MEKLLYTDAGMFALWNKNSYKNIDEYDKWEELFLEDETIIKEIEKESFVPIYFHRDGTFKFKINLEEELSDLEKEYMFSKSDTYIINTDGGLVLSGIEFISNNYSEDEVLSINIEKGLYEVRLFLIEWDKEPVKEDLPDCIIKINKIVNKSDNYSNKLDSFKEI